VLPEQPNARRSSLRQIFISATEPRLRAGWRLLSQVLLQIILTVFAGLVIFIPYGLLTGTTGLSGLPYLGLSEIIATLSITISVFLVRRFLDKRSFISLGLKLNKQAIMDLLSGIGISFVMMGLIFLLERQLGWLTLEQFSWTVEPIQSVFIQVLLFFIVFIVVGWNEELMSRGYHLQTIASGINLLWGLIISSAIFGGLHLANPHATWISAAGIFFAGLFLGYAYIRTKQLWLSIGLHIGWNFFEGVIFGFPVSGLDDIYHLTHIHVLGPEIWTGGAFGPEAGLILFPALVVGFCLVYLFTRSYKIS
jgi:hypothetical protein